VPLKIKINNFAKGTKINSSLIRKTALRVLKSFRKKSVFVEITFVGDRKIRILNRKYMKRNMPTDVLSFVLDESRAYGKQALIGDIYISADTARRNAKLYGNTFKKEILLYVIHGVLHLLGFEDKKRSDRKRIQKLEEKYLKLAAVT